MNQKGNQKIANFIFIIHLFWILWAIVSLPLIFLFDWYLVICIVFLVITLTSWIFFKECLLNRWEYKFRGLNYDVYKTQGTFITRVLKFFSINISRKKAVKINQFFILMLLIATLFKMLK